MATLIKINKSSEDSLTAEYTFEDFTKQAAIHESGRVKIDKQTGNITIVDSPTCSARIRARVIYKLHQHWSAKELPDETSFAS